MTANEDHPDKDRATLHTTATRLRVVFGSFKRRSQAILAEGDLSGPELTALARLDRFGPATTADLARREQIKPQAMGATIASLEKLGLVDRRSDPDDGRRSILDLTPAGRDAVSSGRSAIVDRIATVLAESFTAEEIAKVDDATRLLERLVELL